MISRMHQPAARTHLPLRQLALCLDCDECFEISSSTCPNFRADFLFATAITLLLPPELSNNFFAGRANRSTSSRSQLPSGYREPQSMSNCKPPCTSPYPPVLQSDSADGLRSRPVGLLLLLAYESTYRTSRRRLPAPMDTGFSHP